MLISLYFPALRCTKQYMHSQEIAAHFSQTIIQVSHTWLMQLFYVAHQF